jgi:hypothetical protein
MTNASLLLQNSAQVSRRRLLRLSAAKKIIVRKRSREFARIPVEEYGIVGEQKANIFCWLVWVARPLKGHFNLRLLWHRSDALIRDLRYPLPLFLYPVY